MSCAFTHGDDYGVPVRLITGAAALNVKSSCVIRIIGIRLGARKWWNLPWLLHLAYQGPNNSRQTGNTPSSSRPPPVLSFFLSVRDVGLLSTRQIISCEMIEENIAVEAAGCTNRHTSGRNSLLLTSGKEGIIRAEA